MYPSNITMASYYSFVVIGKFTLAIFDIFPFTIEVKAADGFLNDFNDGRNELGGVSRRKTRQIFRISEFMLSIGLHVHLVLSLSSSKAETLQCPSVMRTILCHIRGREDVLGVNSLKIDVQLAHESVCTRVFGEVLYLLP